MLRGLQGLLDQCTDNKAKECVQNESTLNYLDFEKRLKHFEN